MSADGAVRDTGRVAQAEALGLRLAPLFAGFARFVAAETQRRNHRGPLHFLAREGLFLEAVVRRSGLLPNQPLIPLHISRRASFLPSLSDDELATLPRLFARYAEQTPTSVIASLGPAIGEEAEVLAETFGDDAAPAATDPAATARLLVGKAFARRLRMARDGARDRIRRYLAGRDVAAEGGIALVDLGWSGSMQGDIALLLPRSRPFGLYLVMTGSGPPGYPPVDRAALFGGKTRPRARPRRPFEMLTNAPGGTTVGYRETAEGVIRPCFRVTREEDAVWQATIRHVQNGILGGLPSALAKTDAFDLQRLRRLYEDTIFYPEPVLLEAYFRLRHDESFGLGTAVRLDPGIGWARLLAALLRPGGLHSVADEVRLCGWPQGWLAQRLSPGVQRWLVPRSLLCRG